MTGTALPERGVARIDRIEARYSDQLWEFALRDAARIAARWLERCTEKPALFNGTVLRQAAGSLDGPVFRALYHPCDYASFLAWLEADGAPDPASRNGFALAALRATDGAYLCGVMAPHTASAGRIYFPGGTPDMSDVQADGSVDLGGSALRELGEETGLLPAEVTIEAGFTTVFDGPRVAFLKPMALSIGAEAARGLIRARLASQDQPELSDIHIVRGPADVDDRRMPRFMCDFFADRFGTSPRT